MRTTAPTTLTLPPFRGAVRRIVLVNVVVFFGLALLSFAAPVFFAALVGALVLHPVAVLHGLVWQPLTYAFLNLGILNTAFGLLFLWFIGARLEEERGGRWFTELFYFTTVGGALIATMVASLPLLTGNRAGLFLLSPYGSTEGIYAPLFGVLVAFGVLFAEEEILLLFVLRMRVKYLIAVYVLIDLARLILGHDPLSATLHLACGICGLLYVRYAARRGLGGMVAERYFGARNDYYRWKRRRAARKFSVYMKKQNREVHFDNEGRYISPEDERKSSNDRKWMN